MAKKNISENPLFQALNSNGDSTKSSRISKRGQSNKNSSSKLSSSPRFGNETQNQNPLAQHLGITTLHFLSEPRRKNSRLLKSQTSSQANNTQQTKDPFQLLTSKANGKSKSKLVKQSNNKTTFLPSQKNGNPFSNSEKNNDSLTFSIPSGPSSFSPSSTIHLLRMSNLTPQVTKPDIINIMSKYGTILTVLLHKDHLRTESAMAEIFYLESSSLSKAKKVLNGRKADGRLLKLDIDTKSQIIRNDQDWREVLEDVNLSRNAELAIKHAEEARLKAEYSRARVSGLYERIEGS